MNDRSTLKSKLLSSFDARTSYIKAKLGVLVPSQIRALRLNSDMPRQSDLAKAAGLHQSRISMFETPGAANMTLETLSRLAAAFKVGLTVRFVPFSEMIRWENSFNPDAFDMKRLPDDEVFLGSAKDDLTDKNSSQLGGLARAYTNETAAMSKPVRSESLGSVSTQNAMGAYR